MKYHRISGKYHRLSGILAALLCAVLLASCASGGGTTAQGGETDTPPAGEEQTNAAPETDTAPEAEETHVVILGTSDMHGNIWGFSYEDNTETTNNGMARLYTCVEQVRAEYPAVFLIDAGDDIQGTIMTDDLANKSPDNPHPVLAAMNTMGYDAMTLGNHEFNWGVDNMLKILGQAEFPVLAANIKNPDGTPVTGVGWTIVEHGGVKLAVIGVDTPNIPIWDDGKQGINELTYEDSSAAVKAAIAEIGDQADIIMVSAHMGLESEFGDGADSAQKILEENPEVDVLQVAHTHNTVSEMLGAVPVGGVRNAGREIARFEIVLDGEKQIKDASVEILDMDGVEPSQTIRDIPVVKELHEETIDYVFGEGHEIGTTTARFQPDNEIAGLPEGKLRDTAVIDFINKVQLENTGADVAGSALFKDTSDLPEGAINYGNIFDIYKYNNTLCRVTVTGAELKAYMEWTAGCYNQWKPGDINISFDPDFPGYQYDMFTGIDYEINLSKPKGERIENVMFHGEPLSDDQTIVLAVNNYRYSSTLKDKNIIAGSKDWESSNALRDMIVEYFAEHSPVAPEVDNNWRIVGVDLDEDNPQRAEIIDYINQGALVPPYNASYNLADYDSLVATAKANLESGNLPGKAADFGH